MNADTPPVRRTFAILLEEEQKRHGETREILNRVDAERIQLRRDLERVRRENVLLSSGRQFYEEGYRREADARAQLEARVVELDRVLQNLVGLSELDDEASRPGTDLWLTLSAARELLLESARG